MSQEHNRYKEDQQRLLLACVVMCARKTLKFLVCALAAAAADDTAQTDLQLRIGSQARQSSVRVLSQILEHKTLKP